MDNLQPYKISLDFYIRKIITVNAKQLDSDSRVINITCTENGKKFFVDSSTTSAFVRYKKSDGHSVLNQVDILSDGTVNLELSQQMLAVEGRHLVDIMLINKSELTLFTDDISVTDDGDGNVVVLDYETKDIINMNVEEILTAISENGIKVLSTMSFYINAEGVTIDDAEIESSYEYDALIEGLGKMVAVDNRLSTLEQTINKNEVQRQQNETARQDAESKRVITETEIRNTIKKMDENLNNLSNAVEELIVNVEILKDNSPIYIAWDGNTEGRETITPFANNTPFYKVSNLIYSADELNGCYVEISEFEETCVADKSLFEETEDRIILKASFGGATFTFGVVVKHDIDSATKGIYFMDTTMGDTRLFTEKLSEITSNSGGGVSSWNDLTDKPFYEESTVLFEWDGNTDGLDSIDYGTVMPDLAGVIMYKVSDTPLTYDELLGADAIGIVEGQEMSLEITEEQLIVSENIIGIAEFLMSALEDTEQNGLVFTRGLWHMSPIASGVCISEISKGVVKQLDSKFVDAYTKEQIDTMFGNYVTEVADLVGGEA